MKKLAIAISLAALTAGGVAYAQQDKWDGDMTRAEAQSKATEMFGRLDVNKDGKLDQADRAAHMAQMFDRMDTDHNGQISREEFMTMHEHGPGGDMAGHDAMAGDKDGRGDMGYMGKGRHGRHGGHMGSPGMMAMAQMADTDHDGAISQAEFNAAAMARFDKADTNHDGKLTKDERQAARKDMRDKWREMRGGPDSPPPAG